jgi:hypothetical protein
MTGMTQPDRSQYGGQPGKADSAMCERDASVGGGSVNARHQTGVRVGRYIGELSAAAPRRSWMLITAVALAAMMINARIEAAIIFMAESSGS